LYWLLCSFKCGTFGFRFVSRSIVAIIVVDAMHAFRQKMTKPKRRLFVLQISLVSVSTFFIVGSTEMYPTSSCRVVFRMCGHIHTHSELSHITRLHSSTSLKMFNLALLRRLLPFCALVSLCLLEFLAHLRVHIGDHTKNNVPLFKMQQSHF
jgi:hypothetical protein